MHLTTFRSQALAGVIVVVLVVVGTATVVLVNVSSLRAATARADRDRQVQLDSAGLVTGMLNEETGVRGFTYTAEPQFLDPYNFGQAQVAAYEGALGKEVGSDIAPLLRVVEQRAGAWHAWAEARVAAVGALGKPITDNGQSAEGKFLFDAFRASAASFDSAVAKTLSTAQVQADAQSATVVTATIISAGLILLVVALISVAINRSNLRPLGRLLDAASLLAAGQATEISDAQAGDEVGRLARALAAWQRTERERLTLVGTATELNSLVDLDEILERGAQRLREVLDSPYVTVSVADPGGLRIVLSPGIEPASSRVTAVESPSSRAFRTRQSVITDLRLENWDESIRKWRDEHSGGPALSVPLLSRGEVVGVVTSVRRADQPDFTSADKDRAELLAPSLAAAIRVAHLFDDLKSGAAQLQQANRHKSEFLAKMSHELRTPLNAILGFTELMIDDDDGKIDRATRLRFLGQVHSSGKHLLDLINDVLDLSKVEAGQMKVHLSRTNVAAVIMSVSTTVEPLAAKKSIRLESDADDELFAYVDEGKLRQMVLNLVSNAIKFTPDGGTVRLSTMQDENELEISVSDTGIGMSEEDLASIFQEFKQVDSGLDRQHEGTGLGLALTKRFAELHGGSVTVTSKPGAGSTFTIHIPVTRPVEPVREPSASEPESARPLVLVVEDNVQASELLGRHLHNGGFRMAVARTGAEALAKARELRPVAITLDILLPGIDGWEVLSRLKQDDLVNNIPVVVISVVDDPQLGRALGALDYLVKPIDRDALLSSLGRYTFASKVKDDKVRILVVDDEPANRELLNHELTGAGFTVLEASGGRMGIEMARAQRPNLVLLDLLMPDVTGFDVVEALRADTATRLIPIMVLTAKTLTDEDKRQLNGHVASVFQRNSIAGPELVGWLRQLVEA